ncbi:MAG TPA: hypothetical protein VG407_05400 [Caulobacteraceae bacterium]|nr:hypothetical protein [Caulobacteraceae bacterium]
MTHPETSPEPEEATLEVHHKSKPFHGWREFLKEYGIIVLGVLTALAAEQIAEQIHWAHSVHEAEAAMDAELHEDALNAYYRMSTHECAFSRLDALRTALEASRDHDTPVPVMPVYNWRLRAWQSDAWQAAQAAQIASHFPRDRLLAYSRVYFFVNVLLKLQPEERAAMDSINTLAVNAGPLQPAERDRLFAGLVATRRLRNEADSAAGRIISEAEKVGVRLSDADKAGQLREARQLYGDCVRESSLDEIRRDVSWPR